LQANSFSAALSICRRLFVDLIADFFPPFFIDFLDLGENALFEAKVPENHPDGQQFFGLCKIKFGEIIE